MSSWRTSKIVNCRFYSFFYSFYSFYFFKSLSIQQFKLQTGMNQFKSLQVVFMNSKKPEVSVDALKEIVKKFKSNGFESLVHHDLAVALSTIGFAQVCKEFGATWTQKNQQQSLRILESSQYDLSWFGKVNNIKYNNFLTLCSRGDLEKVKGFMSSMNKQQKVQLYSTVDNFKRSALHLAVKQNFDILSEYLIKQGFSVNTRDRQLKTPLHYCHNELICQVLLNNNAKVVSKDNKYCTPAHYAATGTDFRSLELMLQKSNVVNEVDSTGKTPLFYAVYSTSQEQINMIRLLLENGGKVNEKDIFGKTSLHYASQLGKSRCIPILLQKGASIDIRDKHNKLALDLAANQKVRKIINVYSQNKGIISEKEEQSKRSQYRQISKSNLNKSNINNKTQELPGKTNSQIYTKEINQVSTWIREKFFVLMKKLQQSGVKALWHVKRPYIYTGSWAQDVDGLQDLYETFLNVNGPQAAMRTFNLLCPYQKTLPTVMGKSQEAFQSFFGENWFSTDPIQKIKNMHSTSKIRSQLQIKAKEVQDLRTQLLGYRGQIQSLQSRIMSYDEEIAHYKKVQDELKKERSKNTQQYSEILKLMNEKEELKEEINRLIGGEQKTKILSNLVQELRQKNEDLVIQIEKVKQIEAANRRKCGKIFIKTLSMAQNNQFTSVGEDNLYDDDCIISLYNLLKGNPPNLQARFTSADKRGNNKLNIDQFTKMLQDLAMLPQDVISMHRITGFAQGRKTLSIQEFKTILQNRHKNRPMWQKKLLRKIKTILLQNKINLQQFFTVLDKDGNGTVECIELRKGLQYHNIFMNQNDWSNLFNLLDSDKSGQIDLNQFKTLMEKQRTGKLQQLKESGQGQQKKRIQQQEKRQEKEEEKHSEPPQEQQKQQQQEEYSQQFSQPYEEKDSDDGITKLNGIIKIQVPVLKIAQSLQQQKAYIKFFISEDIDSDDSIKMVDLTLKKLSIAIELKIISYKVVDFSTFNLSVSVWSSREMDEQTYLGSMFVNLQSAINQPQEWAINGKYKLAPEEYDKSVKGGLVLQVRWTPQDQ